MGITAAGTGSGLDLEGLIGKIVASERDPAKNRIDLKESRTQANITAYNNLQKTLKSFQSSLSNLKLASFTSKQTAVSSDPSLYQPTVTATAQNGTYTVDVFEMAKAQKLASTGNFANPDATVGSGGTLNFAAGTSAFSVSVLMTDKLTTIRDKVNNAAGNSDVTASLLTVDAGQNNGSTVTRLVFTSKNTGTANAITISAIDDDTIDDDITGLSQLASNNLNVVTPAQDSRIAVDGFSYINSTNTITTAIEGVSIQLFKESSTLPNPTTSTLTISNDKSTVKKEIEKFVATYNELATVLNVLTNYNPTTETRGLLSGDATVNVLEAQIRRIATSVNPSANENLKSLAFLGIATNKDGSLKLDDAKLTTVLNTKFDKLDDLLSGTDGIATKLDTQLTNILGAKGAIDNRQVGFQKQLKGIEKERDALEFRLQKIEARYRKQFSTLDNLVSQLNQTGSFLGQQLDAAASITNGKR
jgi:flagellar hook-associated protein 2